MASKRSILLGEVRDFYDNYHQKRVRVADRWVKEVYWVSFIGYTLEVGGGTMLADKDDYISIDISLEAAKRTATLPVDVVVANGTELPFSVGAFDTVACHDVLEHVADPKIFLAEMCRVSRRRVVVAGPNWVNRNLGGLDRYLPQRIWSYFRGDVKTYHKNQKPYLRYDEHWAPDLDALNMPNAGFVSDQLQLNGFKPSMLRSWEHAHHWLNEIPAICCLGQYMFVIGEKD